MHQSGIKYMDMQLMVVFGGIKQDLEMEQLLYNQHLSPLSFTFCWEIDSKKDGFCYCQSKTSISCLLLLKYSWPLFHFFILCYKHNYRLKVCFASTLFCFNPGNIVCQNPQKANVIIFWNKHFIIVSDDDSVDGSFIADEDFWEGWWSILACSLVAVETDSWCVHPTALWTDEGLSWGWSVYCPLFLSPAFFLCGLMPLCLELTTGFSHWWAPAVLIWGLLLPWLMADSCLCNLSLQLIFVTLSWSTTITLSFLELTEKEIFGHANVCHPCDVASPAKLHLKQDGLYAGQAGSLEDFFI